LPQLNASYIELAFSLAVWNAGFAAYLYRCRIAESVCRSVPKFFAIVYHLYMIEIKILHCWVGVPLFVSFAQYDDVHVIVRGVLAEDSVQPRICGGDCDVYAYFFCKAATQSLQSRNFAVEYLRHINTTPSGAMMIRAEAERILPYENARRIIAL
jgi:hypothetical protein